MKKIEKQICKSFDSMLHSPYSEEVKLSSRDLVYHGLDGHVTYFLHESCIFIHEPKIKQFYFSLYGYNTVTTRSRLRALLGYFCHAKLFMQAGKLYLTTSDGVKHEINAHDVYSLTADEKIKNVA